VPLLPGGLRREDRGARPPALCDDYFRDKLGTEADAVLYLRDRITRLRASHEASSADKYQSFLQAIYIVAFLTIATIVLIAERAAHRRHSPNGRRPDQHGASVMVVIVGHGLARQIPGRICRELELGILRDRIETEASQAIATGQQITPAMVRAGPTGLVRDRPPLRAELRRSHRPARGGPVQPLTVAVPNGGDVSRPSAAMKTKEMTMKFTLSWLKDHLETDASLDEITTALTDLGLEVEGVENPAEQLAPFKIAYVVEAKQHPNADRLQICMVDDGSGQPIQVICGAPNARAGMKGVFAPAGSTCPARTCC
jgi:hypothetical protein